VRALLQTVSEARVTVDGAVVGEIKDGLLILVGVTHSDTEQIARQLAHKAYGLRILDGERAGLEERSPVLVVSQFTLYADTRKGRRPSWAAAAPATQAEPLVNTFADALRDLGAEVATGRFGAHMIVASINVGPRTVVLEL
jgi:D-tyrosyl-tRNA(Tyr) deacylase